jgi:hypothetical protein
MSTDVSEVRAASIVRAVIETACTSEKSVDNKLKTWQYIPEDCEPQVSFDSILVGLCHNQSVPISQLLHYSTLRFSVFSESKYYY